MQTFEIYLRNDKSKAYNLFSWIFIFINLTIYLYFALFSTDKKIANSYLIALIFFATAFLLKYYLHRKKGKWQLGVEVFFWLLMIGWVYNQQYLVAGVIIVFNVLLALALRKMIVNISEEKISYPSIPVKIISWNDLSNVILKDGLLTIDFKNNRLIQQAIDQQKTAINEKEFNDFCSQQLNK